MCDDITESENGHWLLGRKVDRRGLARMGAGAAALAMLPGCARAGETANAGGVTSRSVEIATPDGTADAFFVHPAEGRHPAVIMWPDIAGLRDAYKMMASRLAAAGYAVLVINQYYRSAKAPVLETFAEWRTDAGQARLRPMIAELNPARTTSDAAALITWLDAQAEVDTAKKIASSGYCMGGPFTLRTAAANPARVGAIASFHGGGLVTAQPDSPHLLFPTIRAAMLLAIAQNDDARDPDAKTALRTAATAAGRTAEIEVYPAQHGWCTIDAPVYAEAEAERAWARMLALFAGAL